MSALASEIDLDLTQVVLDVPNRRLRDLSATITASIIDGTIERTIDGASTLTLVVHDPKRTLLRSGLFGGAGNKLAPVELRLDRLYWRLAQVAKSADDLTLTFEDREIAYLREHAGPKKAARAKMTRAEFALSLVREVRDEAIEFVCPELHVRQKLAIETASQKKTSAKRAKDRDKGIHVSTPGLLIGGSPASISQKAIAERVLDVASSLNAPAKATLALVEACIVESSLQNLSGGDRDSRGVLQVRDSTAGPMAINNRDPEACANAFLTRGFYTDPELGGGGAIAIARRHPTATAGRVAQATQGSGYPTRYDEHQAEAQAFVDAYSGGGSYAPTPTTRNLPYQFRRGSTDGTRENSWDCLQRLAQEVNWRCFVSTGALYFVSERTLIEAKPRFVIDETTPGVSTIDFDVDSGKSNDQVSVVCRASRWLGAPGAVVVLQDSGPADGRWLIATLRRGIFDAEATITLKRASPPTGEPRADPSGSTGATSGGTAASPTGVRVIDRAYSAARSISSKKYPYVWGGGHAAAGVPDNGASWAGPVGYDCSGSTCAVLAAAGLGYRLGGPVDVSGTLASSWGEPGRGEHLTIYANPIHVFIVFHGVGKSGDEHFGTGDWGKGWGGAGFNPNLHPTDGFTARHFPGT